MSDVAEHERAEYEFLLDEFVEHFSPRPQSSMAKKSTKQNPKANNLPQQSPKVTVANASKTTAAKRGRRRERGQISKMSNVHKESQSLNNLPMQPPTTSNSRQQSPTPMSINAAKTPKPGKNNKFLPNKTPRPLPGLFSKFSHMNTMSPNINSNSPAVYITTEAGNVTNKLAEQSPSTKDLPQQSPKVATINVPKTSAPKRGRRRERRKNGQISETAKNLAEIAILEEKMSSFKVY
jgi:hypothetical protein